MISSEGPGIYDYEDAESSFKVVFLLEGKMVSLSCGHYLQVFEFKRSGITDVADVLEELNSMHALKRSAVRYKNGKADKEGFARSLTKLSLNPKLNISKDDISYLKTFIIKHSDLDPVTVRMQLKIAGYERIADDLEFEIEDPMLERTCRDFLKFVKALGK
jgi:hypothetical protein